MEYTTYILFSAARNKYYIGYTGDEMEERLRKHNANHKEFTGSVNDWEIKHIEKFENKELAIKREQEIKNWKSRKRMEKLFSQN